MSDSEESNTAPECRVCGNNNGPTLCRFFPSSFYGPSYVGGEDTDCIHYDCGVSSKKNSEWSLLSVNQIKKTYGQGKAAKLALSKTRTAAGPSKFGNVTELVIVKEFLTNLVAAGGSATPKSRKVSKFKASLKKSSKKRWMKI